MRINRVTITGADNNTNIEDLVALQQEFPFVEWGILFSGQTAVGGNRYPTFSWIDQLVGRGLTLSGHLCGAYSRQVMVSRNTSFMDSWNELFGRFQLNINFKKTPIHVPDVIRLLSGYEKPLILQWNSANYRTVNELLQGPNTNFHVLFDASGGRGEEIKTLPDPFSVYTGYAGGMGPDNVGRIVEQLLNNPKPDTVFIDMEGRVRNEKDQLDLDKVRSVLETVKNLIQ
jgi:hypothetical protein